MGINHTTKEALTAPGVVKSASLELFEDSNEILLTIECSDAALADAMFGELAQAMKSGPLRVGPFQIVSPNGVTED